MDIPCYHCGKSFPVFHPDFDEATNYVGMYEAHNYGSEECRAIVICIHCMDKGDFDMWTDEAEWDSTKPLVPYKNLPPFDHDDPDRDDVTRYKTPTELLA